MTEIFGIPIQAFMGQLLIGLINLAAFVVFIAVAFPLGARWGVRSAEPVERWLREERPATPQEQDILLRFPASATKISLWLWGAGSIWPLERFMECCLSWQFPTFFQVPVCWPDW